MTVDLDELMRLRNRIGDDGVQSIFVGPDGDVDEADLEFFTAIHTALPELVRELRDLRTWHAGCKQFHKNAESVRKENAKLSGLVDHQIAERDRLRAELDTLRRDETHEHNLRVEYERENVLLRAEVERLGNELEIERMRLAGCGVAAHGGSDERFVGMLPEYDSDALRATRKLAAENDRLKAELATEKQRFWDATQPEQLRELREAASKLNQYMTEQEDAEWVNFACLDVQKPVVQAFRAVLAKIGGA